MNINSMYVYNHRIVEHNCIMYCVCIYTAFCIHTENVRDYIANTFMEKYIFKVYPPLSTLIPFEHNASNWNQKSFHKTKIYQILNILYIKL